MIYASSLGLAGDGITDDTAPIQAALDALGRDTLVFDIPACYRVGRLLPRSGCTIVMSGAVSFRKRRNATGPLYLSNVEGVRIYANGATIYGEDFGGDTAFGHTVYALGTTDCEINGLCVDGASPGKDCLYVGLGSQPNQNLRIIGGRYANAKRNCISVVAGRNTLIEGVEATGATGAPGAGIDVEANFFGNCENNTIRRCRVHGNQNAGVLNVFGVGTLVDDCDIYGNGTYGYAVSSGGYQFGENVFRPNVDVIGVTGFDMATGTIFVAAQPPIGTPINFSLRNGAQRPPEFTGSYFVVSRHVGSNGIILGRSVRHSEILSLSTPGAGVMDADPYLSDIRLRAFVDGQSDRCEVRHSRIRENGTQGIFVAGAGRFRAYETEVRDNGGNQVQISYARDAECERLRVSGGPLMGITASSGGGRMRIKDCEISSTGARGIAVAEWTGAEVEGNSVTNCAHSDASSAKAGVHLSACLRPVVKRNRVTQNATNTTTLYGIYAEGTALNGVFDDNDLTGAGTTDANALRVMSPTCAVGQNVGRNGE